MTCVNRGEDTQKAKTNSLLKFISHSTILFSERFFPNTPNFNGLWPLRMRHGILGHTGTAVSVEVRTFYFQGSSTLET